METIINLNDFGTQSGLIFCTRDNDTLFMTAENDIEDYCIVNLTTGKVVDFYDFAEDSEYKFYNDKDDIDFVGVILVANSITEFIALSQNKGM